MNPDIALIVGVGGFVLAIIGAIIAFNSLKHGRDEAVKSGAMHEGVVLTELGYIKKCVEEIKTEQKEQSQFNADLLIRVSHIERDAKSAHKRLDLIKAPPGYSYELEVKNG